MCAAILKCFFLIFAILNFTSADLSPNSRCLTAKNAQGICIEIRKCKPAMDAINAGTVQSDPPTICNQEEQTVCCPIWALLVRSSANRAAVITPSTTTVSEEKEGTKIVESKMGELEEEPLRDEAERISERSKKN